MGYNTDFTLTVVLDMNAELGLELPKDQEDAIVQAIREIDPTGLEYLSCFVDHKRNKLVHCNDLKWYDHEKDMRELSRKCGDVLFKLEGYGDERDDIWVKYFMNGRMQSCGGKITFDDFDPEKLK